MDLWNSVRQDFLTPSDGITPTLKGLGRKNGVDYRIIKKILADPAPAGYQLSKPRRHHKEVYTPLMQPMSQAQVDFFEADSPAWQSRPDLRQC